MRLIFAGTPEFARTALERLHASGHTIALVLTQPDRPAGRGLKLQASAVKQFAVAHGLPVAQPRSLRLDGKYPDDAAAACQAIAHAQADAMVVAAYGLILPQWVLNAMASTPRQFGCLNIHGSLLPALMACEVYSAPLNHRFTFFHLTFGLPQSAKPRPA